MSEHELDKLFSKKLASRTFDYNPKAWEAMEEMLDEHKRSYAFYWRSAVAILLVGGLLGFAALTQIFDASGVQKESETISNVETQSFDAPRLQEKETIDKAEMPPIIVLEQENTTTQEITGFKAEPQESQEATEVEETFAEHTPQATEPSTTPAQETPVLATEIASTGVESTPEPLEAEQQHTNGSIKSLPSLAVQPINATLDFTGDPLYRASSRKMVALAGRGTTYANIAAMASSLNYSSTQGAGFVVGVGHQIQLDNKWQLGAELNLVQRNTPNFASKKDSVFYGFGQERITHTTEVKSLTHLQLPVYVNRTIANKHRIGIGAYAAVLLYADVVTSKEERSFDELIHKSSVSVNEEKDWVNPVMAGGFVQYSYILSGDVELGVRAGSSFTDISNDNGDGNGNKRLLNEAALFLHYGF